VGCTHGENSSGPGASDRVVRGRECCTTRPARGDCCRRVDGGVWLGSESFGHNSGQTMARSSRCVASDVSEHSVGEPSGPSGPRRFDWHDFGLAGGGGDNHGHAHRNRSSALPHARRRHRLRGTSGGSGSRTPATEPVFEATGSAPALRARSPRSLGATLARGLATGSVTSLAASCATSLAFGGARPGRSLVRPTALDPNPSCG